MANKPTLKTAQPGAVALTKTYVKKEVIAQALSIRPLTVTKLANSGVIPCIKFGGNFRYDLEAVLGAIQ